MTVMQGHVAGLARGRRLLRTAMTIAYLELAWDLLLIIGTLLAVRVGWLADDYAPAPVVAIGLAIGWVAVACAGMVALFTLALRGKRLVRRHIRAVADSPPEDVPDNLQIGTARPGIQVFGATAITVGALIALPVLQRSVGYWLVPESLGAIWLIAFVRLGPSVLGISSAYVDDAGIRLPLVGIEIPWTSIRDVRLDGAFRMAVTVIGPVNPTGDQPRRWTDRALARHRPGAVVRVPTKRPEWAIWVSRRHLNSTGPVDGRLPHARS